MAMKNVAKRLVMQRGFSLIELLVASSLGLIVLGSIGAVFLSGYNLAAERTKQLMLAQGMNDAIRLIKNDVQRAGFNANNTGSLMLSGSTSTFVVPSTNDAVSYIYEDENAKWRIVKFRLKTGSPKSLQMCVDTVPKAGAVMQTDATCGSGNKTSALLDLSHITITNFSVTPTLLASSSASSTLLNISLTASLKNSSYSKTVETSVKARNWN